GHPYLKALLRAVPRFHMAGDERLTPIREVRPETGRLLAGESRPPQEGPAARPLLEVRGLTKRYGSRKAGLFGGGADEGVLAVDDVSFAIERGECLGLVGESGCGKSTLSKIVMRALTPDRGEVLFDDDGTPVDLLRLPGNALFPYRRRIQYMFQDPFSALNPRMTAFDIVSEPLVVHRVAGPEERREIVRELMHLVGLSERYLNRYPHSFSGGQRQRLGIARALALKPELLLCDEPVSALDVSVQAQILNLLKDLQKALGLTYLFVSHNLAVVDYMADRIAVMCAGRLVELARRETLFRDPRHPYTKALLAAVPEPDLDYPLDFQALADERASKPELWPGPYRLPGGVKGRFEEVEEGHFVRVREDMAPGGLAA
ncbi:MAG: ABC transporter ATP-binding protein, partial [Alphaproteobacteria bacterium]|nr:ABC transporter ATP-binding protein [Alphaproteobacteria bacterium]